MKTTMIRILFLLCTLQVVAQSKNTTVHVMVDKTMSIAHTDVLKSKYTKALQSYLEQNIKTDNDEAIVTFIYELTGAFTNRKSFVFKAPKQPDFDKLFGVRKQQAQSDYNRKVKLFKDLFIKEVLKKAFEVKPTGKQTHILAALGVMADISKTSNRTYKAILLSDLIEESPIRNTKWTNRKNTIKDRASAIAAAKKDLPIIKSKYAVNSLKAFSEMVCVLPVSDNTELVRHKEFEVLPIYFKTLFEMLGLTNVFFK